MSSRSWPNISEKVWSLSFSFSLVDFGVDELMEFSAATNCPWLLSNVIDNVTEKQLAGGEIKRMVEWGGRKVGCLTGIYNFFKINNICLHPSTKHYSTNRLLQYLTYMYLVSYNVKKVIHINLS